MRTSLLLTAVLLLAQPATTQARRAGQKLNMTAPPNIVFILMDDVGYSDLPLWHAQGIIPTMDAILAAGFACLNTSTAPICSPTRRTLYYGDYWSRNAENACSAANGEEPPAGAVSIGQVLGAQGYANSFLGKWDVGSNPVGQWRNTLEYRWGAIGSVLRWFPHYVKDVACLSQGYNEWRGVIGHTDSVVFDYQPRVMLNDLFSVWPTLGAGAPKFMVYAAQLGHIPLHIPPADQLPPGYVVPPVPTDRQKFDAMGATLDYQIAQMLSVIDSNTIVIVMGDNGTAELVSSNPTHAKTHTFQEGVHVPLFLMGPGIPVGSTNALVASVDIFATLAELGGATPDPALDSRSIVPLMNGTATKIHDMIAFGIQGDPMFDDDLAARSLRYKFRQVRPAGTTGAWTEEFYDLAFDPNETNNLIAVPSLQTKIAQHRAFVAAELP